MEMTNFCIENDLFCIEFYEDSGFNGNMTSGTSTIINETKGQGVGFWGVNAGFYRL